jgi:hypothetical protein
MSDDEPVITEAMIQAGKHADVRTFIGDGLYDIYRAMWRAR